MWMLALLAELPLYPKLLVSTSFLFQDVAGHCYVGPCLPSWQGLVGRHVFITLSMYMQVMPCHLSGSRQHPGSCHKDGWPDNQPLTLKTAEDFQVYTSFLTQACISERYMYIGEVLRGVCHHIIGRCSCIMVFNNLHNVDAPLSNKKMGAG